MEIRRDRYLERLIAHKGNGRVKIVTGIRRCGKSYLRTGGRVSFLRGDLMVLIC